MSFTCDIQLRCDSCGDVMHERAGIIGLENLRSVRWDMQHAFNEEHGMTTKTLRRRTKHLCHKCADTCEATGTGAQGKGKV